MYEIEVKWNSGHLAGTVDYYHATWHLMYQVKEKLYLFKGNITQTPKANKSLINTIKFFAVSSHKLHVLAAGVVLQHALVHYSSVPCFPAGMSGSNRQAYSDK